eukprot:5244276-Amphidinium_carterae.1
MRSFRKVALGWRASQAVTLSSGHGDRRKRNVVRIEKICRQHGIQHAWKLSVTDSIFMELLTNCNTGVAKILDRTVKLKM